MQPQFNWQRLLSTALAGLACLLITAQIQAALSPGEGEPAPTMEPDPPRMVFGSVIHNAGNVDRGEMINHTFTFRNTGGSDLVILSTKAG